MIAKRQEGRHDHKGDDSMPHKACVKQTSTPNYRDVPNALFLDVKAGLRGERRLRHAVAEGVGVKWWNWKIALKAGETDESAARYAIRTRRLRATTREHGDARGTAGARRGPAARLGWAELKPRVARREETGGAAAARQGERRGRAR